MPIGDTCHDLEAALAFDGEHRSAGPYDGSDLGEDGDDDAIEGGAENGLPALPAALLELGGGGLASCGQGGGTGGDVFELRLAGDAFFVQGVDPNLIAFELVLPGVEFFEAGVRGGDRMAVGLGVEAKQRLSCFDLGADFHEAMLEAPGDREGETAPLGAPNHAVKGQAFFGDITPQGNGAHRDGCVVV